MFLLALSLALLSPAGQNPDWQTDAGGHAAFEVASVKPDTGPFRPPNFPLDAGNSFLSPRSNEPPRGRFSADFPLFVYITFAYKLTPTPDQRREILSHLPKWVVDENYAIEAKAPGNPTKDQIRLMMQALLADRFHLALHFETRDAPALALTLIKPGKPGPKLLPHEQGPPCDAPAANLFPSTCEIYGLNMREGKLIAGSRNTTIGHFADMIPTMGAVDRAVVDRTGLTGNYDFTLEWVRETPQPSDIDGLVFIDALREQLGLKLEPARAPIRTPVIDHVERPIEN